MEATLFSLSNSEKCGGYTHFLQVKAATTTERAPIHIIAVIDISGSMQFDNKLDNVKKSLKAVLDFMTPTDMLSIVTFSKSSETIACRTLTTSENKYILSQKIESIDIDCSTNISSGLISAFECQINKNTTTTHKTSILLLTDGEANEGITEPDALINLIRTECSADTTIYTFGYGTDHNGSLLSLIADECDGSYSIVNSLENVASAIGCAFGSIASCFAQNIAIEGAEFYSGFPKTIHGGVRVGDMTAGGETGVLMKNLGEIEIKGYLVHNGFAAFKISGDSIEKNDADADAETNKTAYITYMRIKLATYISGGATNSVLNDFEAALEGDDDIIKLMRREIQELRKKNNKVLVGKGDNDTMFAQHANFYRNLRTQYSAMPAHRAPLGELDILPPDFTSPVVRSITQNVYSRATRFDENENSITLDKKSDPSDNILSIHNNDSMV